MWSDVIPNIAFGCQYVYSAILGVAALHLLSLNPQDVGVEAAAYQYIDETVSSIKDETPHVDSENSLNLFTTAMLLTIHTKLRSDHFGREGMNAQYSVPLDLFHFQAGARYLFHFVESHIEGSGVKAFIDWRSEDQRQTPRPQHFSFPEDPLLELWDADPDLTAEQKETCEGALAYLALLKDCISKGERRHWMQRRLSVTPSMIPPEFLPLLQEEAPIALAILARVFALLKFVDGSWWLKSTAEDEVMGLVGMVSEDWKWAMEWPVEILNTVKEEHQRS